MTDALETALYTALATVSSGWLLLQGQRWTRKRAVASALIAEIKNVYVILHSVSGNLDTLEMFLRDPELHKTLLQIEHRREVYRALLPEIGNFSHRIASELVKFDYGLKILAISAKSELAGWPNLESDGSEVRENSFVGVKWGVPTMMQEAQSIVAMLCRGYRLEEPKWEILDENSNEESETEENSAI